MLTQDIQLYDESISMKNGHAGCDTIYHADSREVVHTTWCSRRRFPVLPFYKNERTEERLPVPRDITTKEELIRYIRSHHSTWLR